MKINIQPYATINDIQQSFKKAYPFLKIEFYDCSHAYGEKVVDAHRYDPGFRVSTIAKQFVPGIIDITPWRKTGDVEVEFKTKFGLFPQIFRNENGKWIQTTSTDTFTIDGQDYIGRNLAKKGMQELG
jgi:hypothetical protein